MIRRSGLAWAVAISVLLHAALFSPAVASWMAQALGSDATLTRADAPGRGAMATPPPAATSPEDRPAAPDSPDMPDMPEPITLGDDAAPDMPAAAWIPWEAFEALRAPRGPVDQPTVQSRVTPTPDAPADVPQPTPPANPASQADRALASASPARPRASPNPSAEPGARPSVADDVRPAASPPALTGSRSPGVARRQEPGAAPTEGAVVGEQRASAAPIVPDLAPEPGLMTADVDQPSLETPGVDAFGPELTDRRPDSREASDRSDPAPDPDAPLRHHPDPPSDDEAETAQEAAAREGSSSAAPDASASSASSAGAPARPTAAPQDEQDLPPVRITTDEPVVVVGQVITARGLRITTAAPEWSVVALMSARPVNPVVRVTFSPAGEVTHARIVRSSGYSSVDAPILISLYRWRASGERLETLDQPFDLEIRLILR